MSPFCISSLGLHDKRRIGLFDIFFQSLEANGEMGCSVLPAFLDNWGYRPNPAAGGARTCPRLPQKQLLRAIKVPADLAKHAHRFFFSTLLGLTGPRRTLGLTDPSFHNMFGGGMPPQIY